MWALAPLGVAIGIAILSVAFAPYLERLLFLFYERELATLDIPERSDEKILTYPLA
ncbi:MAG: hypothetical protein ACRENA_04945 [Vulcanimicrobiaceae bacterium]